MSSPATPPASAPVPAATPIPAPAPAPAAPKPSGGWRSWLAWLLTGVLVVSVLACAGVPSYMAYRTWTAWTNVADTKPSVNIETTTTNWSSDIVWLTASDPFQTDVGQQLGTLTYSGIEIPEAANPTGYTIQVSGLVTGRLECWSGQNQYKQLIDKGAVIDGALCRLGSDKGNPITEARVYQPLLDSDGTRVDLIVVRAALAEAGMSIDPVAVPSYTGITVACVATDGHPCELASQ